MSSYEKKYTKDHSRERKNGYGKSDLHREAKRTGGMNDNFDSYVIGRNAVMELLKSGRDINKIYIKKGERSGSLVVIAAKALESAVPLVEVESSKLDLMAQGENHQGVIASAALKDYVTVNDIIKIAEDRGESPLVVIADGIEDPQNLGALMRVCEGTGAHGIIIPKRRAVGLTAAVGKASAGAFELVPVAQVANLATVVDELKEKGLWIYSAEAGGDPIYSCDMNRSAAIIVGAEGKGVSRLLKDKSDYIVSIPMYGQINSFNVASAAAVVLCEAVRQRQNGAV